MGIMRKLSVIALRQVVEGALQTIGMSSRSDAVTEFLVARFTDQSAKLKTALQRANERAWIALELSLAGESFWERCKASLAHAEVKTFAQQVRAFLDVTPWPELVNKVKFRQQCLAELREARKAGYLVGDLSERQLAQQVGDFARFTDPQSILDAEWQLVEDMASELKQGGYDNLAHLLGLRPKDGSSIVIVGTRYFFRREVEEDQKLSQAFAFVKWERFEIQQEQGFAALHDAILQQGRHLVELLGDLKIVVLDLQDQIAELQGQIQQVSQAVQKQLEQHQLHRREVRPDDSLSIRNDNERQLVKQLVTRYRALPEEERQQVPALLNGIGKLEVVAGDFDAAHKDFVAVAGLVEDNKAKAEAYFNAYQAALERRQWVAAMETLNQAVTLDPHRFPPFPLANFEPERILGAGGFGVAFLCRQRYMGAQVVVKTLVLADLTRNADEVFSEARVLQQLDHPAIIRISDCGYVDDTNKSRPFPLGGEVGQPEKKKECGCR